MAFVIAGLIGLAISAVLTLYLIIEVSDAGLNLWTKIIITAYVISIGLIILGALW